MKKAKKFFIQRQSKKNLLSGRRWSERKSNWHGTGQSAPRRRYFAKRICLHSSGASSEQSLPHPFSGRSRSNARTLSWWAGGYFSRWRGYRRTKWMSSYL